MSPEESPPPVAVAEMQGLYGAFSFPEKLLQKLWWRGDFDREGARLADGRAVRVRHPGRWNTLGGPDFAGARWSVDGREETGDVEVHLRAADWDAHGHARDPAYDRVGLHVTLFPPERGWETRGAGGRVIPTLVLLPLLHRALEEYAADEAIEGLARRPLAGLPEELGMLAEDELAALLRRQAVPRWRSKVHFAGLRVRRLGWEGACHHAALEVLGYRFNRAPMLRVAGRWPLGVWAEGTAEEAFEGERDGWSAQGSRPANHPRVRLRQYEAWVRVRPDWPARLLALVGELPAAGPEEATAAVRRRCGLTGWRRRLAAEVCGEAVSGPRLDTLVCDGMLPLLAAGGGCAVEGLWWHWFPGDLPASLADGLRQLGLVDGRRPACHGLAQGLLGWLLERAERGG